jgi:hypothetical protein
MATGDRKTEVKQYSFEGEWIPSIDPLKIGDVNFATMENLRYSDAGIEGVLGYSKINSATIMDPSFFKGRAGIFLPNPYSGQSRVLVQAKNTGLSAGVILENKTAIPSTGSFETTDVYTEAANAAQGRFGPGPISHAVYMNGKETCIFGGNEARVRNFKSYDPAGTFRYDYTEVVQNILDDASNVATIIGCEENYDSYDKLILKLNNNVTDEKGHTVTQSGTLSYSSSIKKFGTYAADFDGTDDYVIAAHHADWDVSGGTWCFDGWIRLKNLPGTGKKFFIFYQQTDATNYISFEILETGALHFIISAAGAVVEMTTRAGIIDSGRWYHVAVCESGDNWWIFLNGQQEFYLNDNSRAADYTGSLLFGYDGASGAGYYFKGYMDSIRFCSGSARHTANFEPPGLGYEYDSDKTYMLVGSNRPLKAIKPYVKNANTVAGTMFVFYWDGTDWVEVSSLVDNTASAGCPLATTGSVTFSSTVAAAKPKLIDSVLLYWYKIVLTCSVQGAGSTPVTLYHVTVDPPFQKILDLWDGVFRTCIKFLLKGTTTYEDFTTNVAEEDYELANSATYATLSALASSGYYVLGFEEPMTSVIISLVEGNINTTANTILSVSYWNGTAWVLLKDLVDGTFYNNASHAKSGTISWTPPGFNTEFKTTISNELPLYYYKFQFTQNLSATVYLDYLGGIPAQKNIHRAYRFPFTLNDRIFLANSIDTKEGNRVDYFERNTTDVMNGEDSSNGYAGPIYFGGAEDLTAGVALYNRIGSQIYNVGIFTKKSQTYVLNGTGPEDWKIYTVSETLGCPAPMTIDSAEVGFSVGGMAEEAKRNIAMWLTYSGPVLFDVAVPIPAWRKIRNFFDKTKSECINFDKIDLSIGWFDPEYSEYNLLFPSGSTQQTINKWLVLDLVRFRWFEKKPSAYPQAAFRVVDQYGNFYVYGLFDDGYMRRLEYGPAWDSDGIQQRLITSDQLPSKTVWEVTKIMKLKLILGTIAEPIITNVFHFIDGETTGQTVLTTTPVLSGKRHKRDKVSLAGEGKGWSHQFEFKASSSTTRKGVPWLAWSYQWQLERED